MGELPLFGRVTVAVLLIPRVSPHQQLHIASAPAMVYPVVLLWLQALQQDAVIGSLDMRHIALILNCLSMDNILCLSFYGHRR